MESSKIKELDALSRKTFTYKTDGKIDTWRSHADEALAGSKWVGDCDDLGSTVLDLLHRNGQPLDKCWRLYVDSQRRSSDPKNMDHLVACTVDSEGNWWIVGDTFGPSYSIERMRHIGTCFQRMDKALEAPQAGVPWKELK